MIRFRHSRLAMRGPALRSPLIACGLGIFAIAALSAGTAHIPFSGGFVVVEARLVAGKAHRITHTGGSIAKVHVVAGSRVAAGDLLATMNASDLDAGIKVLRARLDVARRQQEALRMEIQAFNMLLEQRLISRARVTALENEVASLERETADLLARIGESDRLAIDVEIRAPVSGILSVASRLVAGRQIVAGETLAEIATDPSRPILEAALSSRQMRSARAGDSVAVFIADGARGVGHRARARITWIPAGSIAPAATVSATLELDLSGNAEGARALQSHRSAQLVFPSADISIAQQVVSPLRRAIARIGTSTPQPGV